MVAALEALPVSARRPTALHALRSEAADYWRFTTMLRALRRLFAENSYEAAQGAAEGLLALVRDLEQRAADRLRLGGLKPADHDAEDEFGSESSMLRQACAQLLAAQVAARGELIVTLDIIGDLRTHAGALRAVLHGRARATYDAHGAI